MMAGCGSCVKDDPEQQATPNPGAHPRKPLNLKAVDKNLSQFGEAGSEKDAAASD